MTTDCRPLTTSSSRGFTLIELVITLTVLTILTLGVIPLVKISVRRQREQQLREALRQMRTAIDQFHREALAGARMQQARGGAVAGGAVTGTTPGGATDPDGNPATGGATFVDPRVRVAITDATIFGTDNPDRYPPDLETLVNGVSITPLEAGGAGGGGGGRSVFDQQATDNTLTSTKKKIYLREIPIDPMTGERDWCVRSVYDAADAPCSSSPDGGVFDVRSKSEQTALDGETKYNEW
ncbi:MAG TPA: prepilin-type N-terminal cleavage/methylation domain-containing protein [Pyrinomonadaceae bacterium]|nr:prepilin-type N-terminal cleavage/methylation domain-containing protein [Pyrinomonadaceae bacterium]